MVPERKSPIFITGLPRCRTAWLAQCFSSAGCYTTHEGLRDHVSFEDYVKEIEERLVDGVTGDADPGLTFFVEQLLQKWPEARFVVVGREDDRGAALQHVAPETDDGHWNAMLATYKTASDRLRVEGANAIFIDVDDLNDNDTILRVLNWATGTHMDTLWAKRMQRLKVTSLVDASDCFVKSTPREPVAVPSLAAWEVEGLSASLYKPKDFGMVCSWWKDHAGSLLTESALPPLGVIVNHEGEPWAALWCYEIFGVSVAELTFPVTRPGLRPRDAARALAYAATACMNAAGKGQETPGEFRAFKVVCPVEWVGLMKSIGFTEYLTDRVPMIIHL